MNERPITVKILDRDYKLKIKPEDEEYLVMAASKIEEQAVNYKKMYAYKDHQDLLAMVAITKTTQLTKLQERMGTIEESLQGRLAGIDKILSLE